MSKKTSQKTWIILGSLVAIIIVTALTFLTSPSDEPVAFEETTADSLVINKSEISTTATFFPHESNGVYMEIIAIRASDDTVRTALNTCQVCYNSGRGYYEQLGDILICNNCKNQFTIDQIQLVKGGCNPVPITEVMKTEDDHQILIDPEALVIYEPLFENWKR